MSNDHLRTRLELTEEQTTPDSDGAITISGRRKRVLQIGLALLYFFAALLAIELTKESGRIASIWFANAIVVAILLKKPPSEWAGWLIAALIGNISANLMTGDPPLLAVILSLCNTIEIVLVCVLGSLGQKHDRGNLTELGSLSRYLFLGVVLGSAVAAFLASLTLSLMHGIPIRQLFWTWFIADALGLVIMVPLLAGVSIAEIKATLTRPKKRELMALVILVPALTFASFSLIPNQFHLILILAAVVTTLRLGYIGATVLIFLMTISGILALVFSNIHIGMNLSLRSEIGLLQLYSFVNVLIALPIAILLRTAKNSEQRYRNLVEGSTDLVTRVDMFGKIIFVNHMSKKILGLNPEECVGLLAFYFVHREDLESTKAWFDDWTKTNKSASGFENRQINKKTGEIRWMLWSANAELDDQGVPVAINSTGRDITDRKQAEALLAAQKSRLDYILYGTNAGTWEWNIQTGETIYNERWASIIGYTIEELAPVSIDTWTTFTHPDDLKRSRELLEKHFKGELDYYECEARMRHKNGSWVWVLDRGRVATWTGAHKPLLMAGTHTDITKRKRVEEALHESEYLLRESQKVANLGSYVLDIAQGQWVSSPELDKLFGIGTEYARDVSGWLQLVHPDDRTMMQEYLAKNVLTDHAAFNKEYRINRIKPEQVRWVLGMGELEFNTEGNPIKMIGIIQDITDRKRADRAKNDFEKQLMQTQRLESLGVLAGGIAHDFNNILMGILGYADLALSSLEPLSPTREFVDGIIDSSSKVADLIKQMLAYSGKGKFSLEPVSLNDLIANTAQMLAISISKNVVMRFNYSSEPVFLEGDPSQIRQVIMNMAINASDAIGKKSGVIALTTGSMYCDREYIESTGFEVQIARKEPLPEGMYAFMEISDTGAGMSKDLLDRIFEPFYTTKFTGRGLGLSAVLGIVNGHRGMVNIYSEVGKGTTFKVLFPMYQESQVIDSTANTKTDSDDKWQGQGTFLIADDEEAVRTVGKHMIKKLGYDVLTADDGVHAIEIFREHADKIVGVLLDLTMPHKDGAQVFREIRALKPDIRVILSSGYNEDDATQQFVGKGLAGFIQKPYVSKDLLKKIKEVMGTSKAIDPTA
ncbi:MAG: PAS domain-containing protein [Candidatus Marinimicrobia bacterium]|nr:PAS domain-containing protein [Candidatus Neomarinimicrobiota bacterium]